MNRARCLAVWLGLSLLSSLARAQDQEVLRAAKGGDSPSLRALIGRGANANARDENGATVLMWAAYKGDSALVRYLVEHGADPSQKGIIWLKADTSAYYGSVLGIAAGEDNVGVLRYLLDVARIPVDDRELNRERSQATGWSALQWAAFNGKRGSAEILLAHGANPNLTDETGLTPFLLAISEGHEEIAQLLLRHGADGRARGADGWTGLHYAARDNRLGLARELLKRGAAVNAATTADGWTPLLLAAYNGHGALLQWLLCAGANEKATNADGQTAVDLAASRGHDTLAGLLRSPDCVPTRLIDSALAILDAGVSGRGRDLSSLTSRLVAQYESEVSHRPWREDLLVGFAQRLSSTGRTEIVPSLLQMLRVPTLRFEAYSGLHRVELKRVIPQLIAALNDADPQVRGHITQLLAKAQAVQAAPRLTALLHDRSPYVRSAAVIALTALGHAPPSMIQGQDAIIAEDSAGPRRPRVVVQFGHTQAVTSAAFSPDGQYVVTGGSDGLVLLWLVQTGQVLRTFHAPPVKSVAFSPGGRYVLAGSVDGVARLWSVQNGEELRRFKGHADTVNSVAFSRDGRLVVTGSGGLLNNDNSTRVWSVQTGKELQRLHARTAAVKSVAFSPDGDLALAGTADGTVLIWTTATGQELRHFSAFKRSVTAASFSPCGEEVLAVGLDSIVGVWSVRTGRALRRFQPDSGPVSMAVSPDDDFVITPSADYFAIWSIPSGEYVDSWTGSLAATRSLAAGPPGVVAAMAFSSNGERVLYAQGRDVGFIEFADAVAWRAPRLSPRPPGSIGAAPRLEGRANTATSVAYSPDGRYVAIGAVDGVQLWDLSGKRGMQVIKPGCLAAMSVVFSPDSRQLVCPLFGPRGGLAVVSVETGQTTLRLEGQERALQYSLALSLQFSPSARQVLSGHLQLGGTPEARIWSLDSGRVTRRFAMTAPCEPSGAQVCATAVRATFSPDGAHVLTSGLYCPDPRSAATCKLTTTDVWSAETGERIARLEQYWGAAFSPDGRNVLAASLDGQFVWWSFGTNQAVQRVGRLQGTPRFAVMSPDGLAVLIATSTGASLLSLKDGEPRPQFQVDFGILTAAFSPDGRRVVAAGEDGKARLLDAETGRELGQLVSLSNPWSMASGAWAVIDPEGRFDAPDGGKVEGLHWVVGLEPISLYQLKERFYDPGLLAKILGFSDEPLRDVESFTQVTLFPSVEIDPPTPSRPRLGVHLRNRGGGIGRVVVSINGKEIAADARSPNVDPHARALAMTVDIGTHPYVRPGDTNVIEVKAYNAEGYLVSRGVRATYKAPGGKPVVPQLWAIVAGVSDYAGDAIDLKYAAKDAVDMERALQLAAGRLFGAGRVHMQLFTTDSAAGARPPTKDNLVAAFRAVGQEAKSTDILVVYLSGHAVTHGGPEGDLYYLTKTARSGDLADPAVRRRDALSSQEFMDLIRKVPVTKQVVILDVCGAGRVVQQLSAHRDIPSSQKRALERMKDRMGLFVLAGSAADAVSYEASRFAQGLLTYSLLFGIKGPALREDQFVDVSKLFNDAVDLVPKLARDIGGIQSPSLGTPPGAASFDIGQMTPEERAQIRLATPHPLVLRSTFLDESRVIDHLGLAARVDGRLRDVSESGTGATIVFVDASAPADAYALSGLYRVDNGMVRVDVHVAKDGQEVGKFLREGPIADPDDLAKRIVDQALITIGPGK